MNRAQLLKLGRTIAGSNAGGYKSTMARGLPYYGELRVVYPRHLSAFKKLLARSKRHLECDFEHSMESFVDFIRYIGPVPQGMIKPTVGRKDHNLGYVKGNFNWQESFLNSQEAALRNNHKLYGGTVGDKSPNRKDFLRMLRYYRKHPDDLDPEDIKERFGIVKTYNANRSFRKLQARMHY